MKKIVAKARRRIALAWRRLGVKPAVERKLSLEEGFIRF